MWAYNNATFNFETKIYFEVPPTKLSRIAARLQYTYYWLYVSDSRFRILSKKSISS
ncbi:hypothetical protein C7972_105198 [Arenibacter sp. ARW7G5Y1]|nr:hypothetical protein C7972_105198 [Arenibacter sp. ARW7G5Y1]